MTPNEEYLMLIVRGLHEKVNALHNELVRLKAESPGSDVWRPMMSVPADKRVRLLIRNSYHTDVIWAKFDRFRGWVGDPCGSRVNPDHILAWADAEIVINNE
jgi:hypothetical protein